MFNKKGVSLVTVMLFMLIATIAATATYKWLSSEQRSSASRMKIAEAQQASRAGLEAVRAWMTYNANDVGALMHQYYKGNQKPIQLDSTVKAFGSSKQNYKVWLTGVDTTHTPYKLKITSVGGSRNEAKYSEVSVLKVGGLYRVKIPEEVLSINFDQAFSGKVGQVTSSNILQSALINGDLAGNSNTPKVLQDMVVAGNVSYQGGTNQGKDLYIKGDFFNKGSLTIGEVEGTGDDQKCVAGKDTNVLYIGGSMTGCAKLLTVCGDLYVGGGIVGDCKLYVSGNMTVNGKMVRNNQGQRWEIGKNMVFTENSALDLGSNTFGGTDNNKIGRNAYFPKWIEGHCGSDCGDLDGQRKMAVSGAVYYYENTEFTPTWGWGGITYDSRRYYELLSQNDPLPYGAFMKGTTQAEANNQETRKKKRMLSFSAGQGLKLDAANNVKKWERTDNVLKNVGDAYWNRIDKMKAYGNLIDDGDTIPQPLLLNNASDWLEHLGNDACKTAGYEVYYGNGLDDTNIDHMNSCYSELKKNNPDALYNGFLVLKMHNSQLKSNSKTIDGKFVLYYDQKPSSEINLPPTASDAVVMLYFTQGAGTLQKDQDGDHFRYFIYSEGDIDVVQSTLTVQGSMIMAKGATLKDLRSGALMYEASVISALASAGIVKENPDYTARVNPGAASGSETSTALRSDSYFVATSPQLNISLESQYKSREKDPDELGENDKVTSIEPSILVLPRVIYLTQDAPGRLEDYYSVINLNKANVVKNPSSVSCDPSFPTTGVLYNGTTKLSSGIYSCRYTSTYEEMPFWVVVAGENGTTPQVNFHTNEETLTPGGAPATVRLEYAAATRSGTMTIDVRVVKPESWVVTPTAGVSVLHSDVSSSTGDLYYTVTMPTTTGYVNAFTVSVPAGASSGYALFELVPPNNGCIIGSTYPTYTVSVTGFATINRMDIPASYCGDGHEKLKNGSNVEFDCDKVTNSSWPSCPSSLISGEWIYPYCNNMSPSVTNSSWTCGTNFGISLRKSNIPSQCEVFVADTTLQAENDETYTLFASLKRKRYTLRVGQSGNNAGASTVVNLIDGATATLLTKYDTDENGYDLYHVYADQTVDVIADDAGENRFANWRCAGESCLTRSIYPKKNFNSLKIASDVTLTAFFNERDKHCFYDAFSKMESSTGVEEEFFAFCGSKSVSENYENCVDKCKSGTHCEASSGNHPKANWTMVYANHASSSKTECLEATSILNICKRHAPNEFEEPYVASAEFKAPALGDWYNRYSPTVLLNRVQAGFNGTMTLKMSLPTKFTDFIEKILSEIGDRNDGIILRSDIGATEYLSLNVYRGKLTEGQVGAQARLCYVKGQMALESADCIQKNFKNKLNGNYVPVTAFGDMTVRATLNGSVLDVALNYMDAGSRASGTVSFDLTQLKDASLASNKPGHEYVGLKMFNPNVTFRDISWTSEDYSSDCFNAPRVYCSFKGNYIGGTVPLAEDVSPWVGWSSWFDDKGCSDVEYYYNGCDVDASYYKGNRIVYSNELGIPTTCSNTSSNGGFWYEGAELVGDTYNFKEEGDHRVPVSQALFAQYNRSGFLRKASIRMLCDGQPSWADCGAFYVGEIKPCEENAVIYSGSTAKQCSAESNCEFLLEGSSVVNLRDSRLSFTISSYDRGNIRAFLVDKKGVKSEPFAISSAGSFVMEVNDYIDVDSFDPQNISGVVMNGDSYFEVSSIESSCRNAPGIGGGCYASMNASGTGFDVRTPNISHTELAASNGCVISNDQGLLSSVTGSCAANGSFFVPVGDLYSSINSGVDATTELTFTVTMTDKNGNETSCSAGPVEVKKTSMSCDVSATSIYAGQDLPSFIYNLTDCPVGGCEATVKLVEKNVEETVTCNETSGSCSNQTWAPSTVNSAAGDYTYSITYSSLPACTAEFSVVEAAPASASNCKIEGGNFVADITPPEYGENTIKLWYNDPIGNVIGGSKTLTTSSTTYSQTLSSITAAGTYRLVLTVNGKTSDECYVDYTVGGTSSSSSAVSSSSVASSSSVVAGNVTANCWWESNSTTLTSIAKGYQYSNFKIQVTAGLSANTKGKIVFNGSEKEVELYDSGTSQYSNLAVPNTVGSYPYSVTYGGNTICSGTINVIDAASCSVDQIAVYPGTEVTFTGSAVSPWTTSQCGFKINGNWKDNNNNQNLTSGSMNYTITAPTTTFTFECNQGSASIKSCSKTVIIAQAPEIDCDALNTSAARVIAGDAVKIAPSIAGCAENCSYTIQGSPATNSASEYTYINHATADYTSGDVMETLTAVNTVNEEVEYTLSVTNAYGSDNCVFKVTYGDPNSVITRDLTTTFTSFTAGSRYKLKTGGLGYGPHSIRCKVSATTIYARTVGVFNGTEVVIPAHNSHSGTVGGLTDNTEYEFVVAADAPSDLECGLSN